jgi:hypothetical protein
MPKIWNDQTESSYKPKGGVWQPEQPKTPNAGNFQDSSPDRAPNAKRAEDSDQTLHVRDKM